MILGSEIMVIYPCSEQSKITEYLRSHYPWSRVTTSRVCYKGQNYMRVTSSDLNVIAAIRDMYPINRDPNISSM